MMMTTKIGLNYPEIAEERKLSYDNARMKIGRCLDGARLIHLVLGGRGGSLLVAGQSVTQSESRRAMVWKTCVAPGHSGRSYWIRLVGCGTTDRVGRIPKEPITFLSWRLASPAGARWWKKFAVGPKRAASRR